MHVRLKIPRPSGYAGSSPAVRTLLILTAFGALAACDRRADRGPVIVSLIGPSPQFSGALPRQEPDRIETGALAQGLVRFDAAGQIDAGLAERWIVIDGGLRYIFRLRAAAWNDGSPVTTTQVTAILKRRLRDQGSALAPFLTAIDDVVAMTPQVVEVRLSRPRPDLLKLFAQPELAIVRQRPVSGSGPFQLVVGQPLLLRPAPDPDHDDGDGDPAATPRPEQTVRLTAERTALAVARFARRESDLVLGGTFVDWPVVAVAALSSTELRLDPTAGLFGLAVARREGLLADSAGRAAVAAAFDRAAIAASFGQGLPVTESILPERLDSAAIPAVSTWSATSLAERRAAAAQFVATFADRGGGRPTLTIGLPAGPGSTLLFRRLAHALATIGVDAKRVDLAAPTADLRLIDRIAPFDSARWYLRTACAPCGEAAETALEAARLAPTLTERARAIALADAALAEDVAYIPLARPLRWSLVAPRLSEFQGNARAWHPLDHLRNDQDR